MARHNKITVLRIARALVLIFALVTAPLLTIRSASAGPITVRSVTIGSSLASTSTTYAFAFTVPSATVLKSVEFTACTTASGSCTTPSGFSASSSSLTSQPTNLGDASGWTVNTGTAGSLRLKKTANSAAPTGAQAVSFSGVVNPSATNATFFLRMTTYSDDAWTTVVDTGTLASSTAGQVTISVPIDEILTFTLADQAVTLNRPTPTSTGTGTSTMTVSINAPFGYTLSYSGSTLTSGSNTITPLASPTASTVNNKQFGINLVSNTTPSIGAAASGSGSATPATGYNAANQFKFAPGDTVAVAASPTNSNTFTVSYIVNMDGSTAAGVYSTTLTYIVVANF